CADHRNRAKNTCAWKNNCWHSQIWRSQTMRNAWAGRMSCKMQNIRSSSDKADGADGAKGICDPKELPRLCRADRPGVPMGRHGRICQTSAAAIAGSVRDCGCTHVPWREAGDAVPEGHPKTGAVLISSRNGLLGIRCNVIAGSDRDSALTMAIKRGKAEGIYGL